MLYDCCTSFSGVSGLAANVNKSSIYFSGVSHGVQQEILNFLCFSRGQPPFRYLGVPLSTKRISIMQCQPLLEKMLGRTNSWTSRYISYKGRLQLIKTVLFDIQIYWSRIFVLPKKIIKRIETICRTYLWTGGIDSPKKALLAWEKVCCQRTYGGFNVLDLYTWNRAAICQLLWNLCRKTAGPVVT